MLLSILTNPSVIYLAGLNGLWTSVLNNWIAPIFFAIVAITAFGMIRGNQIIKVISFLALAAVIGALIFFGSDLFGKEGIFSGMAHSIGKSVGNANSSESAWGSGQ